MALLTQGRLVRVDRATDRLEPGLAESWAASPAGDSVTLRLRRGVSFSDGAPFTSADVLFSLQVAYDAPGSVIGNGIKISGRKLDASAPDAHTVALRFPAPFAPGLRILDNLPILPRHRLEAAFRDGTIRTAWTPAAPLTAIAGLGPFVLTEHAAGRRMVFARNPHYWRSAEGGARLPVLDGITVEIIPDQNAEALRVESGAIDVMSNGDIRADDYVRFRRAADQDRLRLVDGGVSLDPDLLWFNLAPGAGDDGRPWLQRREFRQALAHAVDRQALADTIFRGAAVPIFGPITPRNGTWYSSAVPSYPYDPARARQLLAQAGLADRDGDGALEDRAGKPARFSILLQQGHTTRERTVTFLQEQFRRIGIGADAVGLDLGGIGKRWQARDYDTIFHGFQASSTDPAMNLDFWLSSGSAHVWNPSQASPATAWEGRVDELMRRQAATSELAERQRIFAEVQRLFGEEVPAIYFVAPKMTLALSPRVRNVRPAPQIPQVLWNAEELAVAGPAR